jgi:hypothetical protein
VILKENGSDSSGKNGVAWRGHWRRTSPLTAALNR